MDHDAAPLHYLGEVAYLSCLPKSSMTSSSSSQLSSHELLLCAPLVAPLACKSCIDLETPLSPSSSLFDVKLHMNIISRVRDQGLAHRKLTRCGKLLRVGAAGTRLFSARFGIGGLILSPLYWPILGRLRISIPILVYDIQVPSLITTALLFRSCFLVGMDTQSRQGPLFATHCVGEMDIARTEKGKRFVVMQLDPDPRK